MKSFLLTLLVIFPACRNHNQAEILEHGAVTLAKYYQPKVEALDQRVQVIFKRGTTIPASLPGIDEVGKRLTAARDGILQLSHLVGPGPDGKSPVEKQAAAAAKNNQVGELEKLVHDTEVTLETNVTVINDNLDAVESWIAQYDRLATIQPSKPAPAPEEPTPNQPAPPAPKTPQN